LDPSIDRCFQILGVPESATLEEMKEAYKDLAKVWHPDRFVENPRLQKKATERLTEINVAYETLLSYYERESAVSGEHESWQPFPAETPGETDAGSTPAHAGRHRFTIGVIIMFAAICVILSSLVYMDSRRKAKNVVSPPVVLIPDRPKTPEPDGIGRTPKKSSVDKAGQVKTRGTVPGRGLSSKKEHFTLGSSKDDVLVAQGTPTQISDNRWNYGFSYVEFEKGKVVRWHNSDENPLRTEGVE
jgi:hypothetical protein